MENRGIILLSVVIILLTIALIGASLVAFLFSVDLVARATVDETKAFYLAEAGLACAINTLRNQTTAIIILDKPQVIGPIKLGEGTYTITIDHLQSLIVSKGEVGGSKKTLQLQYNML